MTRGRAVVAVGLAPTSTLMMTSTAGGRHSAGLPDSSSERGGGTWHP